MTYDADQVPGHLLIKIEQRDDPVSAVSEDDARNRWAAYPTTMWGAPVFGSAQEVDGRWRIVRLNADTLQDARDSLASHFRKLYSETPPTAENAAARAEYERIYELLDWEPINEPTVNGFRYRIIRAQTFIRMGPDGPEPPRPTDPDPHAPGTTDRSTSHLDGFVIDPTASTGLTDGLVRMEMISASYPPDAVPADMRADSRRALTTHPNVVLLPVGYTIGACIDGSWRPRSSITYATPQDVRDAESFSVDFQPDENTPMEEYMAAYQRARAEHKPPRTDEFEVRGVPCRVTRIETFVRVGPDGPEGPRPSDPNGHLPPARLMQEPDPA
ncbi:DUF5954 family protein [Micromonospora sp. NBC_01813]|uniref:DUF5954 family protein n=1 Tax=Micromonospora sp. NBC_01813 TaxID=2975988 RepID=UPI002DDB70E3|nr:DUF5954 family protein [Micromonospora sp. NBC_01813]WSA08272.1 DUF5954 family protein [Micromonospora sp. NBC_01813]